MVEPLVALTPADIGAVFYLVACVVGVIIVITWIIFPFMVVARLNWLVKAQREATDDVADVTRKLRELIDAAKHANVARAEANKALQWMVDNWRERSD